MRCELFQKLHSIVFLHNGLGDLIMAFPFLEELRRHCRGEGKVLVFVKCSVALQLLKLRGFEEFEIRVLNRRIVAFTALALRLRRPERVFAPQACGDWRMPLIAKLIGARTSYGPDTGIRILNFDRQLPPQEAMELHKVVYYREYIRLAGFVLLEKPSILLRLPEPGDRIWTTLPVRHDNRRRIVLAPGSCAREQHKRWPAHNYSVLGRRLLDDNSDAEVILLGGPDERKLLEQIRDGIGETSERCLVFAEPDIAKTIALLSIATCLVAGCSGSTHLAAAAGIPMLVIYGPTNPGNTVAWSDRVRIVRLGLQCSPCYRPDFLSGCARPVCITAITPEIVYRELQLLLVGSPAPPIHWSKTTQAIVPSADVSEKLNILNSSIDIHTGTSIVRREPANAA